jgi:hypothetical protein
MKKKVYNWKRNVTRNEKKKGERKIDGNVVGLVCVCVCVCVRERGATAERERNTQILKTQREKKT